MLDRAQAVSDTGSGGCPPEVVMAGVVLIVGTGSGCRACICSSCNNNSLKFGSISEKSPKSDDVEFDDADDVEHIDKTLDSINVDRVGRM
ncbi:hypothetical protein PV325_002485 [Microctonus aethiopoides]|nr:hypothetical protein PV325_002485 [Microctonus aethiopoides]